VKVGLVVLLLKRELDSLTECLRWWWSGWPPLLVTMWVIPEDLGNFSPKKEKNLGEQKFACLSVSNFRSRICRRIYSWSQGWGFRFTCFNYLSK
jgi:hypothetical protein